MRSAAISLSTALLAATLLLPGCALFGGEPPPDRVAFIDSRMFDDQLHDALGGDHAAVTVTFRGNDANVNRLPPRLDKWLYIIAKASDGTVDVVPDPDYPAPKNIGLAITIAIGAYKIISREALYWPVRSYNATVYYQPVEGTLTRVVFTRRPEDA